MPSKKITKTKKTGITKKRVSKKILKTRIAIILDRSGSMGSIRTEAVSMFNQQIKAIQETAAGVDTKVSLVTFSTVPDKPLIWNEDVSSLKELPVESYIPNGWTAMYDAVGSTIDAFSKLEEFGDKNTSFLIVVISDGQENYSREYNSSSLATRIKALQKTKRWTFSYLGANQDLSKVAETLNIPVGNVSSWTTTVPGAYAAASVNSAATRSFVSSRAVGTTASTSFYSTDATDSDTTKSKKSKETKNENR